MIEVFTDGSAIGNPGNGGYGIILYYKGKIKELSAGYRLTTNNRMELLAVIIALESINTNEIPIKVYSDSKYVIDSINKKWLFNWEKKSFVKTKNADLWIRFLKTYRKYNVQFEWVKGHNGHPQNERCDILAVQAANGSNLLIDEFYENNVNSKLDLF